MLSTRVHNLLSIYTSLLLPPLVKKVLIPCRALNLGCTWHILQALAGLTNARPIQLARGLNIRLRKHLRTHGCRNLLWKESLQSLTLLWSTGRVGINRFSNLRMVPTGTL